MRLKIENQKMNKTLNILFSSNGHGEDIIACQIIRELKKISAHFLFSALSLNGSGRAYRENNVRVLGPDIQMPSGGFVRLGLRYLIKDISKGLLNLFREQVSIIKKEGRSSDFVIAVGDTFLCTLCGFFSGKKVIFVSTAQSVHIGKFLWIDKWLMKHYSEIIFPRDEKTALDMKEFGIPALCLGNIMMDCLEITGEDFGICDPSSKICALLPGSREEAYSNIRYILDAVEEICIQSEEQKRDMPKFILALAPSIKTETIGEVSESKGWVLRPGESGKHEKKAAGFLEKNGISVTISGKFADILNRSDLCIGLSGTGNEQAVGLGKPVIAFPAGGPQMKHKFLKYHSKLLGGMVFITRPDKKAVAEKFFSLLNNQSVLDQCRIVGTERMGLPGAAQRIARHIYDNILQSNE